MHKHLRSVLLIHKQILSVGMDELSKFDISQASTLLQKTILSKNIYSNIKEYEDTLKNSIPLLSLKFTASTSSNISSGRNILFKRCQLKGAGRTAMCEQFDYANSWGGITFDESFTEYYYSHLLNFSLPLGANPVVAFFKDTSEIAPNFPLLRLNHSFRLAQIPTTSELFSPLMDECLKNFSSPESYIHHIIFQFASFTHLGFTHQFMNSNNFNFDGSLIDLDGILSSLQLGSISSYHSFEFNHPIDVEISSIEDLISYLMSHNNYDEYSSFTEIISVITEIIKSLESNKKLDLSQFTRESVLNIFTSYLVQLNSQMYDLTESSKKDINTKYQALFSTLKSQCTIEFLRYINQQGSHSISLLKVSHFEMFSTIQLQLSIVITEEKPKNDFDLTYKNISNLEKNRLKTKSMISRFLDKNSDIDLKFISNLIHGNLNSSQIYFPFKLDSQNKVINSSPALPNLLSDCSYKFTYFDILKEVKTTYSEPIFSTQMRLISIYNETEEFIIPL
jgi:hypothetical protein